jgi:peptidase E
MTTKFVLHGGFNKIKGPVQIDDHFFQEIVREVPDGAKVLLVYFAEREEKIPTVIEQDKEQFIKNAGLKKLNFKVASEATFEDDCHWADVIYLHGGKTVKIMEVLGKFRNIAGLFKNKVVGGDSAGANCLAQFCFSKNSKEIRKGLGILPFKIVVHYEDNTPNPLENIEPQLETLLLHEYETKVIYI